MLNFLYYLHQSRLIALLPRNAHGIVRTQKPERIYLDNTNILYALPGTEPNAGTLRETFVHKALQSAGWQPSYAKSGDFRAGEYLFEVGGRNKGNKQIAGVKNAFRLVDNTEAAFGNRIPLWLMSLLKTQGVR